MYLCIHNCFHTSSSAKILASEIFPGSPALLCTALPYNLRRGKNRRWENLLARWPSRVTQKLGPYIVQGINATGKPSGPPTSHKPPGPPCSHLWDESKSGKWSMMVDGNKGEFLEWEFISTQWKSTSKNLAAEITPDEQVGCTKKCAEAFSHRDYGHYQEYPTGSGVNVDQYFSNFNVHQVTWDHTKMQVLTQRVWSETQDATFLTDLKVMMLWEARIQQVRTQSPISEHISYETLGFSLLMCEREIIVRIKWHDIIYLAYNEDSVHWLPSIFYFYSSEYWDNFQEMMFIVNLFF